LKVQKDKRGFERIEHPTYLGQPKTKVLVAESSAIGPHYEDALDRPGSSFLWLGDHFHLDREEVTELAARLNAWRATGSLKLKAKAKA
jgi:hypothetical protein